ncbi:hypothetical protein [Streptomyces sp. B3I8]|uniref:hypothetical protein n=1 Tax=Streptomyces sp. B3I8 TaxID=3042303 RepID=UPI0027875991|nr:hypothetical protein [Streptomyces sp. B3I8]MDQ0784540.1 hypothetical protein [Streptomyces sp. B3I8]
MLAVYNQGNELPSNHSAALTSPQVWLAVLDRAYGLGGLAVRLKEWPTIRLLAYQRGTDHGFSWHGSWLRHGLTNAARAGMLNSEGTHSSGLIAGAHNVVREVPALHPGTSADDDTVLNSLCQFDALGALVVMGETGITDSRNFYTNFARYYTQRTEPALVAITRDDAMREALFAGDAGLLRKSLRALVHIADKESFAYSGWEGISDPRLREALVD